MPEFRYPHASSGSPEAQIGQIRSYLHQLVDTLNNSNIGSGSAQTDYKVVNGQVVTSGEPKKDTPQETFNSIKSLIIQSADIIDAYYDEMSQRFDGEYVAQSEFGTYKEETSLLIQTNSQKIQENFSNLQDISGTVDGLYDAQIKTDAYIKRGILDYADDGAPIYGVEIGQTNEIDGVATFEKFGRFTSDRLSFYDQNGNEVAYFSDYKMHITNAEISSALTIGQYQWDMTDGAALVWIGG